MFKKTGQARVQAIIKKVSTIVDELDAGIAEIDSQIRVLDAQQAQIVEDTMSLSQSKQVASRLAANLSRLTED